MWSSTCCRKYPFRPRPLPDTGASPRFFGRGPAHCLIELLHLASKRWRPSAHRPGCWRGLVGGGHRRTAGHLGQRDRIHVDAARANRLHQRCKPAGIKRASRSVALPKGDHRQRGHHQQGRAMNHMNHTCIAAGQRPAHGGLCACLPILQRPALQMAAAARYRLHQRSPLKSICQFHAHAAF
jgi:hypothetical protein